MVPVLTELQQMAYGITGLRRRRQVIGGSEGSVTMNRVAHDVGGRYRT
jgi:hypothetical protein